jgi:pyridoxamine---pyruvate transaminase
MDTRRKMKLPDFTLSAGPVMSTPATQQAMSTPIIYHYDPSFLELFRETERKAAQVFKTSNDIVIMQGEAILALEAGVRSLVRPGMKILNLVQGVFGKGTGHWLKSLGGEVHEIEVPYNQAVPPDDVRKFLQENPDTELITLVHSETPSGTVTDLKAIGPMAREFGVMTMIDAVSSVGGLEFETDKWGLDLVVTGAQKCLGGPAGIGLVSISDRAWAAIESNPNAPRDSYLSLLDWKAKWKEKAAFPFTPSVSDIYGVHSALEQVLAEGLDEAIARHSASARVTRAGVEAMGLELWPATPEIAADCVTSVRLPDHINDVELRTHIRDTYGVMLSSGQGAGNLMRIAHMGPSAQGMYPVIGLSALGRGLSDMGAKINIGAGVEAALALLSSGRK